jgi:thioredoxin-dependent peroxiredoxin
MLQPGDPFPDFSLPNQNGEPVSRQVLLGKPAVLFFYPKDDTSG